MKKIQYILLAFLAITIISCEEEDTTPQLDQSVAPMFTSGIQEGDEFVFLKDEKENTWVTLNWSAADFGPVLATTYTVEVAESESDFSEPFTFSAGSGTSTSITVENINQKIYDAGYLPQTPTNMQMRIKANVSDLVTPLYSDPVGIVVSIYDAGLPKLYVPGTHQSPVEAEQWDPATAPVIYSKEENEKYSGYVYFASATDEFKFTTQPNWDGTIFGGSDGNLDSDDNIVSGAAGMHYLQVDTLAKTYLLTPRVFGLIGSSTPTGWDSDTNLEYDYDLKKLKITVDLTASGDLAETGIKFRANDSWDFNYGDSEGDGILDEGGTNIAVPESGNYTIYVDLSTPTYTYELVKN